MKFYRVNGTNGSGKSTVVRSVMSAYDNQITLITDLPNPKNPDNPRKGRVYATRLQSDKYQPLVVFGPYDSPTGGIDKFNWKGAYPWIFGKIRGFLDDGFNVLGESITMSADRNWVRDMVKDGYGVQLVTLNGGLAEALEGTNQRRAAKGRGPLDDPHRVEAKHRAIEASKPFWRSYNVPFVDKSREDAVTYILESLKRD